MSATFQNSAMVLSIGVFFSLMMVGLAASLPGDLEPWPDRPGRAAGRRAPGRPPAAGRPPLRVVPGLEPDAASCSGPAAAPRCRRRTPRTSPGRSFFPSLMPGPFALGLDEAFDFAIVACLIAAACVVAARRHGTSTTWSRTSFRPSRSTASSRFRPRATDSTLRRVVEPAALVVPALEGAGAGWVCGAGGVALVDCLGDVRRAGSRRVALFEPAAQLGPGVASRPWPGGSVGQAVEMGLDCLVSGLGQAPRCLPHPQKRPCEIPPVSLPLELDAGVPRTQRHAYAVAQPHPLRLSAGAVDADHAYRLLGRQLARLVQGGEVVRCHGESLAGGGSRVGDGVLHDGAGEHRLSFHPHDMWHPTPDAPEWPAPTHTALLAAMHDRTRTTRSRPGRSTASCGRGSGGSPRRELGKRDQAGG